MTRPSIAVLIRLALVVAGVTSLGAIAWDSSPFHKDSEAGSVPQIRNRSQYDNLALHRGSGRVLDLPQLLFIVDRTQDPNDGGRVYWIDSMTYNLHYEFVRSHYLSTADLHDFNQSNYLTPERRFVIGSVVRYPGLDQYGVEMWEGDTIDLPLLRKTMAKLQKGFYAPIAFKPNSDRQERLVSTNPGFPVISPQAAYGSRDAMVLNTGWSVGKLRIVDDPDAADIGRGAIVILKTNPITLDPVAGVITTHFTTPLSHVNLLAGTWNVPNAYLRDADTRYAALNGQMVVMEATAAAVSLRPATNDEANQARTNRITAAPHLPRADLQYDMLPSLAQQGAGDVIRTGAKSANLGEVFRHVAKDDKAGFTVPPGFTIPFHYYDAFVHANGLDRRIDALLSDQAIATDRTHRRKALSDLRNDFMAGRLDPALMEAVSRRRSEVIGPGGVFARSSTNSEDLKGFNGAGLYTSVPNVTTQTDLEKAIRTVWASVWNDRAYEAREAAGIDHRGVKAAVLVQLGMNADSSGVLVTADPFDPADRGSVFINAKRGLGMRVVEGRKVAEQLLYHGDSGTVQVLTRSTDDTMLTFDAKGGVRPVTVDADRAILTDDLTRRLAHAGLAIQSWFHGDPQDVEWLTVGGRVVIVQARPYRATGEIR